MYNLYIRALKVLHVMKRYGYEFTDALRELESGK